MASSAGEAIAAAGPSRHQPGVAGAPSGGLDWLAAELHAIFDAQARSLLPRPVGRPDGLRHHRRPDRSPGPSPRASGDGAEHAPEFTSCGWFFDDIAGIETPDPQVRGAGHRARGTACGRLEAGLLEPLARARSNDPAAGTAADLYRTGAVPGSPRKYGLPPRSRSPGSLDPAATPRDIGPYHVEAGPEERLAVQQRRTGRIRQYLARVLPEEVPEVSVEVRDPPDGSPIRVTFADLPEAEQETIRAGIRRVLRPEVLDQAESGRVADGLVEYRRAIADALVRQLPADPAEADGIDLEGITRALDLLAVENRAVPFDAQTRYARLLAQGPPELRRTLRGLAERFGFAIPSDPDPAP